MEKLQQLVDQLFKLVRQNKADEVRDLIAAGVNVNALDANGNTALLVAIVNGHKRMVKTLLRRGAKIQVKNKRGQTALELARQYGHEKLAVYLEEKMSAAGLPLSGELSARSQATEIDDEESASGSMSQRSAMGDLSHRSRSENRKHEPPPPPQSAPSATNNAELKHLKKQLEQQVVESDAEVKRIRKLLEGQIAEVARLEGDLKKATMNSRRFQDETKAFEVELQRVVKEAAELREERDLLLVKTQSGDGNNGAEEEMRAEIEKLKKDLDAARAESEKEKLDIAEKLARQLQAENERLRQELTNLRLETDQSNSTSTETIRALQQELESARATGGADRADIEKDLLAKTEELEQAKKTDAENQELILLLKEETVRLQTELDQTREDLDQAQEFLQRAADDTSAQELIALLKEETTRLQSELDELKESGGGTNTAAQEVIAILKDDSKQMSAELQQAKEELAQLRSELVSATELSSSLAKSNDEMKVAVEQLEQTLSETYVQLSEQSRDAQELRDLVATLQGKIHELEKASEVARALAEQEVLEAAREASEKLEVVEAKLESSERRATEAQADLTSLREELISLTSVSQHQRERLVELEHKKRDVRIDDFERMEREVRRLRSELDRKRDESLAVVGDSELEAQIAVIQTDLIAPREGKFDENKSMVARMRLELEEARRRDVTTDKERDLMCSWALAALQRLEGSMAILREKVGDARAIFNDRIASLERAHAEELEGNAAQIEVLTRRLKEVEEESARPTAAPVSPPPTSSVFPPARHGNRASPIEAFKLQSAEKARQAAESELESLQRELAKVESERDALKIVPAREEWNRLISELASCEEEKLQLEDTVYTLETQLKDSQEALDASVEKISEAVELMDGMRKKISELEEREKILCTNVGIGSTISKYDIEIATEAQKKRRVGNRQINAMMLASAAKDGGKRGGGEAGAYTGAWLWTVSKVSAWIKSIGFYDFAPVFEAANIDGPILLTLEERELEVRIGMDNEVERARLLEALDALRGTVRTTPSIAKHISSYLDYSAPMSIRKSRPRSATALNFSC